MFYKLGFISNLVNVLSLSMSLPVKSGSSQIHNTGGLVGRLYLKHFLDVMIIILVKSPIGWRQRPDVTIAVD